MKKNILLLLPIMFWGCQKEFNNVVDVSVNRNYAKSIIAKNSVTYMSSDSLITFGVVLNTSSGVSNVYCDIISPDGSRLNNQDIQLYDNGKIEQNGDSVAGDLTYSDKFPFSHYYLSGNYEIDFYTVDLSSNSNLIAKKYFYFNNSNTDVAPMISNLVAPDTVTLSSTQTLIFVSVDVHDDNGLHEIQYVYFNSYLPNGNPSSSNPIYLFDDGTNGDVKAGDGTYSINVVLPPTGVTRGTYRWEFFAKGHGDLISNSIIHNIVVK
ncbi:MAG: choice-of-anchor X domain-containing protein [Ignavibacteriaceae bacterium]